MALKPTLSADSGLTLGDTQADYYVLGGGPLGESIVNRLSADGCTTVLVEESNTSTESRGHQADPGDIRSLEESGLSDEATVIVATRSDRRNLLLAQLVRVHFDPDRLLVLVNSPDRYDLFVDTGHEPLCVTSALSETVVADL